MKSKTFVLGLISLLSIFVQPAFAAFPNPPTGVAATNGTFTDRVEVSWTAPAAGATISAFYVYRYVCDSSPVQRWCRNEDYLGAVPFSASPNNKYVDTGIMQNVVYCYSVESIGVDGLRSNCAGGPAQGYARSEPAYIMPIVSATDGTYTNKVVVTWPVPGDGSPFSNFQLHRTTNAAEAGCSDLSVYMPGLPVEAGLFEDTVVVPGRRYYYSLKGWDPSGTAVCSNLDPGYARISPPDNVNATDGTYENKIVVTWNPPPAGDINGYNLYRDTTNVPCGTLLYPNITGATYTDMGVVPGVKYYYSLKTISPTGESVCSSVNDGFARIGTPGTVAASDGTYVGKVQVTWTPPAIGGQITGYNLFRDTNPSACSVLLAASLTSGTTIYADEAVAAGVIYYYSVQTVSPAGTSACTNVDPGYAKVTKCSNGLDDDGDGRVDLADPGCKGDPKRDDEKDPDGPVCDNGKDDDGDGKIDYRIDGKGDPGCDSPGDESEDDGDIALKSPAYVKFNTFLGQWNFAELINQATIAKSVDLTIYNLYGQEMITRTFVVPANSEVDVDINSLITFACGVLKSNCDGFEDLSATTNAPNGLGHPDGVVDTYGLVKLAFNDSDPNARLLGRMSFYRPNEDGATYSFAFAREFRNPTRGITYGTANTYDPQGMGNLVPNWAEVINFEDVYKSFTINIYDQKGLKKYTKSFTLPPLGELDVQAGHEFVDENGKVAEGVFLVEVVPNDFSARYFLSVSRYSSNSPGGVDPGTYNYAFAIEGLTGTREPLYAPIRSHLSGVQGVASSTAVTNWVEVANVGSGYAFVTLTFRDANGNVIDQATDWLAPKSQHHYNASALLPKGTSGSVQVNSDSPVIVQSLSYIHGAQNDLQSGFVVPGRTRARAEQAGTINSFLQMQNVLDVFSTATSTVNMFFNISSFHGTTYSGAFDLGQNSTAAISINNNPTVNFPANTYGALLLTSGGEGQSLSQVLRVRTVDGAVDFVMPTQVE